MYAIIRTGGKQYKVKPGEKVRIDSLKLEVGESTNADQVLAIHDGESLQLGNPTVASAEVQLQVVGHGRGRKIIVFTSKRRGGHHRKKGHRQEFTEVLVEAFLIDGKALEVKLPAEAAPAPEPKPAKVKEEKEDAPVADEAAPEQDD